MNLTNRPNLCCENQDNLSSKILDLKNKVENSYAHNSYAYDSFEKTLDLKTIVEFLIWDNAQPPFYQYLEYWINIVPNLIQQALQEHIKVEVDEKHSLLFKEMLTYLKTQTKASEAIDYDQLNLLNYTFSKECAQKEHYGFFLGGFFATEIMSAKRSQQILKGLTRLGISKSNLSYLVIHCEADVLHSQEVAELLLKPSLNLHPDIFNHIQAGLKDRIQRSSNYLTWYETNRLVKNNNN